jgi:hypothetical protein
VVAAFLGMIPGGLLGWLFGILGALSGVDREHPAGLAVIGLFIGTLAGAVLGPVALGVIYGYLEAERERRRG